MLAATAYQLGTQHFFCTFIFIESLSENYQQSSFAPRCTENKHSTCNLELNNDFIQYVSQSSFNDEERFAALEDHFKPNKKYKFPTKQEYGKLRSFQHSWLDEHSWLAYSPHVDGAFCKVCVLFGIESGDKNASKLDKLVKTPLTFWTTAKSRLKDHEAKSQLHKSALIRADNFQKVAKQQTTSIEHHLSSALSAQIAENRKKLSSIIKTILFCGRHNLPLTLYRG